MPDIQSISVDFVDRPRAQATLGRAYTLTAKVYVDNTQQIPTSGTIDVTRPGGAALPTAVSGAAVSVDGAGTMTYAVTAANLNLLEAHYAAVWHPVISGVTYDLIQLFDCVRFPLRNPVRQADLVEYRNDLTDLLFSGQSDFQADIENAYRDVYAWLLGKGRRPYLVLDSEALRRPIETKALEKIFRARSKTVEDRWWATSEHYKQEYELALSSLVLVYDLDQTGNATGTTVFGLYGEERPQPGAKWRV